jgi:enoyl-CoA hydratase/carnithine racemase
VEDAEVEKAAAAMAAQLAALPPEAVAETKRLLRAPHAAALSDAMDRERAAISERLRSAEARALFAAFLNRKG